jgi:hypothetical protein
MNYRMFLARPLVSASLAWLAAASPGVARLQAPPPPAPSPPLQGVPLAPAEDPQQRLLRLMREVERNLRSIDVQLSDAAAGEVGLEARESGLAKLLEEGQRSSRQVVRDIDTILELAAQLSQQKQQNQKQGQGRGQGQQPGGKPEQSSTSEHRQGAPRPAQREPTPEQGEPKEPGDGQQPTQPKGPPEQRPQQRPGGETAPPGTKGDAVPVADSSESWGELPELVRDVFHSQGSSDLPVHYRDWIDGYWERLRERPR